MMKKISKITSIILIQAFLLVNICLAGDRCFKNSMLSPQLSIDAGIFKQVYTDGYNLPAWQSPDIVGLYGGTGGSVANKIIDFSDLNEFLLRKMFVNFFISPHDDGGSSIRLQLMLGQYLGYIPSPGDTNNILSGFTSFFKRRLMRYRFSEEREGTLLRTRALEIIHEIEEFARPKVIFADGENPQVKKEIEIGGHIYEIEFNSKHAEFMFKSKEDNITIEAKVNEIFALEGQEFRIKKNREEYSLCLSVAVSGQKKTIVNGISKDENWQNFKTEILQLADILDEKFINDDTRIKPGKRLSLAHGSMGNFIIVAKMLQCQAYDPLTKKIDEDKYHQGIDELCRLLDIENGFVSFSTFNPAVLYAKLNAISLVHDDEAFVHDDEAFVLDEESIKSRQDELEKLQIEIKKLDYEKGKIEFSVQDFPVKINEFIEGIVRQGMAGKTDSFTEITLGLDDFLKFPELEFDGTRIRFKFDEKKDKLTYTVLGSTKSKTFAITDKVVLTDPEKLHKLNENEKSALPSVSVDMHKKQISIIMDKTGRGISIFPKGRKITLKGRLVVSQTNISENFHHTGFMEFGFINDAKPQANAWFLEMIKKAPLLIMGPGSLHTSLLSVLLIPEVVDALAQRKKEGKTTLFIFNPTKDNESVNCENVSAVMEHVERVIFRKFGEIFTHAVVNDIQEILRVKNELEKELSQLGPGAEKYEEVKEKLSRQLHLIIMMNEFKGRQRSTQQTTFSKYAKMSRGWIDFSDEDMSNFIAQNVEVIPTQAVLSLREVRKAGAPSWEASVRYSSEHLAKIIDDIFWSKQLFNDKNLRSQIEEQLGDLFDDEEDFRREIERRNQEMGAEVKSKVEVIKRIVAEFKESALGITKEESRDLAARDIIITNLKHSLLHFSESQISNEMKELLDKFLRNKGKLIVISGFGKEKMQEYLTKKLDPEFLKAVIIAPSYGTEAWYWDEKISGYKKLYSFYDELAEETALEELKSRWLQIVENTIAEFELDRPLRFNSNELSSTVVKAEDRKAQIAIRLLDRRHLSWNTAADLNMRLKARSLPLIDRDGMMRTPILKRLNDMFEKYKLPIKAVAGGTGSINTLPASAANKADVIKRILWVSQAKEVLPAGNIEKRIIVLGKGNFEVAKEFEKTAPWWVFREPKQRTDSTRKYTKKYGVAGVKSFLKELLVIKQNENHSKLQYILEQAI